MEKVGRNDPCPCGSGKKFKKCHGRQSGRRVIDAKKIEAPQDKMAQLVQKRIASFPLPQVSDTPPKSLADRVHGSSDSQKEIPKPSTEKAREEKNLDSKEES